MFVFEIHWQDKTSKLSSTLGYKSLSLVPLSWNTNTDTSTNTDTDTITIQIQIQKLVNCPPIQVTTLFPFPLHQIWTLWEFLIAGMYWKFWEREKIRLHWLAVKWKVKKKTPACKNLSFFFFWENLQEMCWKKDICLCFDYHLPKTILFSFFEPSSYWFLLMINLEF